MYEDLEKNIQLYYKIFSFYDLFKLLLKYYLVYTYQNIYHI
jgi:hypothetical protein